MPIAVPGREALNKLASVFSKFIRFNQVNQASVVIRSERATR